MNKYIVLLRGINVGGHNKLPMADLRTLLSKNNYKNVHTYIQSGNVILESDKDSNFISSHIKELINASFGYSIPVICLSVNKLMEAYNNNPFFSSETDTKTLHLTTLKDIPKKELIDLLNIPIYKNEQYTIYKNFVYLYTPDGFAKTKFSNERFEKQLNTVASSRNWKTITKLIELTKEE